MRISIIGAYGYTGKLICEELQENGFSFSIAGRNEDRLAELKPQFSGISNSYVVDLRDLETTKELLENSDIIINCAGPFTEESAVFVNHVASSGKTYLDISGEVGFVRSSRENNHETAINSGSLIVHGAAFESMLVDLALAVIQPQEDLKVYYRFNQKRVSPGTRITMKLAKHRDLLCIQDSNWESQSLADGVHSVSFDREYAGVPYSLPEIAFAHWNTPTKDVNTYLLLEKEEAKYVSSESKPSSEILPTLERLRTRKKDGPSANERLNHKCQIFIESDGQQWVLNSNDMYQTTAACIRLLIENSNTDLVGVQNPAAAFQGKELDALQALNITLEQLSA